MSGPPPVLLDACVLVNFSLYDTLLRLAEPPRLYEPRWSQQVIAETTRALEAKLNWPRHLAEPPRLYEPRWSQQVIAETTRALEAKLNWPRHLVEHFESELRAHFADAWVEGYGHLIASVAQRAEGPACSCSRGAFEHASDRHL